MTSFNSGPGRDAGFDPSENVDMSWLGGTPLANIDAEKGKKERANPEDAWRNYRAGGWNSGWKDQPSKEQWKNWGSQERT
eukprot:6902712-Prorocentrum_lima.AAC.1